MLISFHAARPAFFGSLALSILLLSCVPDLSDRTIDKLSFDHRTTSLPDGKFNTPYKMANPDDESELVDVYIRAKGGSGKYTFRVVDGELPNSELGSFSLEEETGKISGKTFAAGEYTFTVEVRDRELARDPARQSFTIRIWNRLFNSAYEEYHFKAGFGDTVIERRLENGASGGDPLIQMADPNTTIYEDSYYAGLKIEEFSIDNGSPTAAEVGILVNGFNPNWTVKVNTSTHPGGYDADGTGRPYFGIWRIWDPDEPEHEIFIRINITTIGFISSQLDTIDGDINNIIGWSVNNGTSYTVDVEPTSPASGGNYCMKVFADDMPDGIYIENTSSGQKISNAGQYLQASAGNIFQIGGKFEKQNDLSYEGFRLKVFEIATGQGCTSSTEEASLNFDTTGLLIIDGKADISFDKLTLQSDQAIAANAACIDTTNPFGGFTEEVCHGIGDQYDSGITATSQAEVDNPVRYRVLAGSLPAGLSRSADQNSYTLSGHPTAAASSTIRIEAYIQGYENNSVARNFTFNIGVNIRLASASLGLPLSAMVGYYADGDPNNSSAVVDIPSNDSESPGGTWQFEAKENIRYSLVSGTLPGSLALTDTGCTAGYQGCFTGRFTNIEQQTVVIRATKVQDDDPGTSYPANSINVTLNFNVGTDIMLAFNSGDGDTNDCDSTTNCDTIIGNDHPVPDLVLTNPEGYDVKFRWSTSFVDPEVNTGLVINPDYILSSNGTALPDTSSAEPFFDTGADLKNGRCNNAFAQSVAIEAYIDDPANTDLTATATSTVWTMKCQRNMQFAATAPAPYNTVLSSLESTGLHLGIGETNSTAVKAAPATTGGNVDTEPVEWHFVGSNTLCGTAVSSPLAAGLETNTLTDGSNTNDTLTLFNNSTGEAPTNALATTTLYLRARLVNYPDNCVITSFNHSATADLQFTTDAALGGLGIGEDASTASISVAVTNTHGRSVTYGLTHPDLSINPSTGQITGNITGSTPVNITVTAALDAPYQNNNDLKIFTITPERTIEFTSAPAELYMPYGQVISHTFAANDAGHTIVDNSKTFDLLSCHFFNQAANLEFVNAELRTKAATVNDALVAAATPCTVRVYYTAYPENFATATINFGSFRWGTDGNTLSSGLAYHTATHIGSNVHYVALGFTGTSGNSGRVYTFDNSGGSTSISNNNTFIGGLGRHAAVYSGGELVVQGGALSIGGGATSSVKTFNGSIWTNELPITGPPAASDHSLFLFGSTIHLVDGGQLYALDGSFNASSIMDYTADFTGSGKAIVYPAAAGNCAGLFSEGQVGFFSTSGTTGDCNEIDGLYRDGIPSTWADEGTNNSYRDGMAVSNGTTIDGAAWYLILFRGSGYDKHSLVITSGALKGFYELDPIGTAPAARRFSAVSQDADRAFIFGGRQATGDTFYNDIHYIEMR